MILISLSPFALRRVLLLLAGALILSAVSCFGSPTFCSIKATPYDGQMARIQPVLALEGPDARPISLALVNRWIKDLRQIPYAFSMQWKTPAEVNGGPAADCKGKAVTLYQEMRLSGAKNLRLIIGRRTPTSHLTHTWLEWTTAKGTYILDPTFNWAAWPSTTLPANSYVPYYAYSGTAKYRAVEPVLYARM